MIKSFFALILTRSRLATHTHISIAVLWAGIKNTPEQTTASPQIGFPVLKATQAFQSTDMSLSDTWGFLPNWTRTFLLNYSTMVTLLQNFNGYISKKQNKSYRNEKSPG